MKFDLARFYKFCSQLKIESKEDGPRRISSWRWDIGKLSARDTNQESQLGIVTIRVVAARPIGKRSAGNSN